MNKPAHIPAVTFFTRTLLCLLLSGLLCVSAQAFNPHMPEYGKPRLAPKRVSIFETCKTALTTLARVATDAIAVARVNRIPVRDARIVTTFNNTQERAESLRPAVAWAKENGFTMRVALEEAIRRRSPHALALVEASFGSPRDYEALGDHSYKLLASLDGLFAHAVRHYAPLEVLLELVIKTEYANALHFYRIRQPNLLNVAMNFRGDLVFPTEDWTAYPRVVEGLLKAGHLPSTYEFTKLIQEPSLYRAAVVAMKNDPTRMEKMDHLGQTALQTALVHNNRKMVRYLLGQKAEVLPRYPLGIKPSTLKLILPHLRWDIYKDYLQTCLSEEENLKNLKMLLKVNFGTAEQEAFLRQLIDQHIRNSRGRYSDKLQKLLAERGKLLVDRVLEFGTR